MIKNNLVKNNLISLLYYLFLFPLLLILFNFKSLGGQVGGFDSSMLLLLFLFVAYNIYFISKIKLSDFLQILKFNMLNNLILPLFFLIVGSNFFDDLFKSRFYTNFISGLFIFLILIILFSSLNYFLNHKNGNNK
ncbi:MAG: hypothetical protein HRU03_08540 [Nanoarchaeales archaeon]|nr:hypothetical protein [Nanoarchaeales archaeon]